MSRDSDHWNFDRLPSLPIVTPPSERRSDADRYGLLFYLGIAGLLALAGMIGWFAWGRWSLRTVWNAVYVLHDPARSEAERVQAAYKLGRDPRANQTQLMEIALRRPLPAIARYVVAESLTSDAASDPRTLGFAVARSDGWPDWLRILMIRPLAYSAAVGRPVDPAPLLELARSADPALRHWARYTLAARGGDDESAAALEAAASTEGSDRPLAHLLVEALHAPGVAGRVAALDAATRWLRAGHPGASAVWQGWRVEDDRLVPEPTGPQPGT